MITSGLCCALLVATASAAPAAPVPLEPIGALLDAFKTSEVVGLSPGESHGDLRGPAFVVSLIRDPRFAATSIDVVMENGDRCRALSGARVDAAPRAAARVDLRRP